MIILASRSLSPGYPNRIYFFLLLVTISVRLPFHHSRPTSLRHYILGVQLWGCRHLMVHGGRNPWHNAEAYFFCDCSGFNKIKSCASGILAWSVHSLENVLADWNQRADRSVLFFVPDAIWGSPRELGGIRTSFLGIPFVARSLAFGQLGGRRFVFSIR